ncbi:glycosyltransferase [Pseudanabaena sp. Chao 1811]|uniref:glycosyltransferase n=1 Tax=Pseudanabaena sp. Chao 1811 TaxID=2963092 RepID=UPI0022F38463|nr:glycosyltransferase [Pseudanabaena sp. Chao 1811]
MTKKKIGMIVYSNPDYYPPTVNAVYLLSEHFDIVLIGRNQETPHWQYPSNVSVHRLGEYTSVKERVQRSAKEKLWEYTDFVIQSRRLLKDVSLIYAYDTFAYIASYLSAIHIFKKIPLIYHSHEISDKLSPLSSLSGFLQRIERKLIHHATIVVFPDKDRAIFFQTITNLKKTPLIVPNFPLKSVFQLQLDWYSVIPNRWQSIIIFYRGTISNSSSMLEIITSTTLINKDSHIKFVGFMNKEAAKEIDDLINTLQISKNFSYLGTIPYNDLQMHTLSSTIGFALYKNTSFDRVACVTACNKIYEYAACGLPVIVSDFPNYREFLCNESWVRFANPEDPHAIADAIKDILCDFEDYQKTCSAARQAFEERFNYEIVFFPLLTEIKCLVNDNQ